MAFINEYIPQEDIKKHKFDEQFLADHPEYKTLPSLFAPHWTVDRGRNIYLMSIGSYDQAHDEDPWIGFELNINSKVIVCKLLYGAGKSVKFSDSPFYMAWNMISLMPEDLHGIEPSVVIDLLKEALTTYGYAGVHRQIDNTIVKFHF
ncbi:MAG TPA: hypothetical protein VK974_07410 [Methylophilaceae bacterium]|nr:hypothetical protein [Methylophilaceae bacterium]